MNNKRIYSLDLLRGIIAILIVIYHYFSWLEVKTSYPTDVFISRIGVYGVAIFYVLSGITLSTVYLNKEADKKFVSQFFFKRIIRIAPLFYVATLITIFIKIWNDIKVPDLYQLFMNFSFLFGFIDHGSYIVTGGWFIGNILVFYLLFPGLILLMKRSIKRYTVLFLVTIGITLYFAFVLVSGKNSLTEYWLLYIHPLNQLYLFVGGTLIGWVYENKQIEPNRSTNRFILFVSILLFTLIPTPTINQIHYVTGAGRIIFSMIIFVICFTTLFSGFENKSILNRILLYTAKISFPIYLFHPVAFELVKMTGVNSSVIIFWLSIFMTLIISVLMHYFIEEPVSYSLKRKNTNR